VEQKARPRARASDARSNLITPFAHVRVRHFSRAVVRPLYPRTKPFLAPVSTSKHCESFPISSELPGALRPSRLLQDVRSAPLARMALVGSLRASQTSTPVAHRF
jgi:hypothetical protein